MQRWIWLGYGVWHLRQSLRDGGRTVAKVMNTGAATGEYAWYLVDAQGERLRGAAQSLYAAQRAVRKALRDAAG